MWGDTHPSSVRCSSAWPVSPPRCAWNNTQPSVLRPQTQPRPCSSESSCRSLLLRVLLWIPAPQSPPVDPCSSRFMVNTSRESYLLHHLSQQQASFSKRVRKSRVRRRQEVPTDMSETTGTLKLSCWKLSQQRMLQVTQPSLTSKHRGIQQTQKELSHNVAEGGVTEYKYRVFRFLYLL